MIIYLFMYCKCVIFKKISKISIINHQQNHNRTARQYIYMYIYYYTNYKETKERRA